MSKSDTITVEIDLTSELPNRYLGSDKDGAHYGPVSMQEAIVQAAVDRLLKQGEKELPRKVSDAIEAKVIDLIDAELPAIFESALNDPIEVTDEWGTKRPSKSMRDTIAERVRTECKPAGRNSYNTTTMDTVIREQVDYSLKEIFTKEVNEAKALLRKRLTDKAGELLAAESLREAGIR